MDTKSSNTGEANLPRQGRGWFYGWTIVTVVAVATFAGGAEANPVLGIYQGPMTEEFGWSRSQFALPMSIGSFLGGLLGMALGPIMDRHGARWVMTIAALLLGLTFVLMGAVQELWQHFALQIIGRTMMTSTFMMVVGIVIPKWFVQKRGRAVAFANLGQRGGVIAFPFMTERILQVGSWRTAWVAMGLSVWAIAVLPALLFLKRRPEDHGWLPDGARTDLREVANGSSTEGRKARIPDEIHITSRQALRMSVFYIVAGVVAIQSIANTSVQFHWYTVLTDRGVSSIAAVVSIAIAPVVSMPISIGAGFLAERVSVQKLMAFAYVLMASSVLILIAAGNTFSACAFGFAFGVTSGVLTTTVQLIWPYYFGRGSVGAIRGMVAPVHMGANALGPIVAALSYDFLGSYVPIYSIIVGLCLLGALLLLLTKRPRPETEDLGAS